MISLTLRLAAYASTLWLMGTFTCQNPMEPIPVLNSTITHHELQDKIQGGWLGKAYGVAFGGPTEFRYRGEIIDGPLQLTQEGLDWLTAQDDLYVNMALLKAVVEDGLHASSQKFSETFSEGRFRLWHANGQARHNLMVGIQPPHSGHPTHNPHADDIDFQIECDFIGLICPGLPLVARDICDRAGTIMNYGDGLYGGYFITTMYSVAFVAPTVRSIVEAGQRALPPDSDYSRIIRQVLDLSLQYPDDWQAVWQVLETEWNDDRCPWGVDSKFNISAKLNGAYVALGLLYGEGDLKKTVEIATRCGQDSDCNPGNAGGILGTYLGRENFPTDIRSALDSYWQLQFDFTDFSLATASDACVDLALENLQAQGATLTPSQISIPLQNVQNNDPAQVSFPTLTPLRRFIVTDPEMNWSSHWELIPIGQLSMMKTSQAGATLDLDFTGTAIFVQGEVWMDKGIIEVYIDGKSYGTRDLFLPWPWRRTAEATALWVTGLEPGSHHLRIVVTGRKNPESDGNQVVLGHVVSYDGDVAD